jgi:hypothetical protein
MKDKNKKKVVEDPKNKKKVPAKKSPTKKKVEVEDKPEPKRRGAAKAKQDAKDTLSTVSILNYDQMQDGIEKKYDISASQLVADIRDRIPTGLLVQDLILSGGILGGGWYTFFGMEQSAKSTDITQIVTSALNSDVPVIQWWDYEGCTTISTLFRVNGIDVTLEELLKQNGIETPEVEGFIDCQIQVDTLGKMVPARFYYGGLKETLRLETDSGLHLEASNHPCLVQLEDGNLAWMKIEELKVGDTLLQQG